MVSLPHFESSTTQTSSCSDITLVRSTTQPLCPTKISLSLTLPENTLESSTTQPLHLPNVVYLLSSLWHHSWKLNHSTTSSPKCGLSPSLTLISFMKAQPLNHLISQIWCLSLTLSVFALEILKAQPLNHFISQMCSISFTHSDITLESSTTQPLHLLTIVFLSSLPLWYHSYEINHSTTSYPKI